MAIAGAVMAFAFAASTHAAQTINLSGQSALGTCTFSGQLTVNPDGSLTVSCSGVIQTGGATFTLSVPPSINVNTTGNVQTTVTRSATPTGLGPLNVNYNVTGSGCTAASGTLTFADGDTTPQAISITTGANNGTCTVAISPPSPSTGQPPVATINVVGGPSNGCPPPDPNSLSVNVSYNALPQTQASGVIGYGPVAAPQGTKASVYFEQSIGTTTAGAMHTEISVSPCPGAILTPSTQPAVASQCYVSTDYTTDNRLYIYTKPVFSWNSQTALGNRGCWAGDGKAYYVNYRWTYGGCAYGTCGFVLQWFTGPY